MYFLTFKENKVKFDNIYHINPVNYNLLFWVNAVLPSRFYLLFFGTL